MKTLAVISLILAITLVTLYIITVKKEVRTEVYPQDSLEMEDDSLENSKYDNVVLQKS